MRPDCTEGMGPVGTNSRPTFVPRSAIYEAQGIAQIQEARAECERAIDAAMQAFLDKTGVPECQVRALWGEINVSRYQNGFETKGYGSMVTVTL
jgi:hypothetical protein